MKQLMVFIYSLLLFVSISQAQLTIKVSKLPDNSSPRINLYVAGTFNNWMPGNEDFKMEKMPDGSYAITVEPQSGEVRFKFTRGSWATVEGDANGEFRPDRTLTYNGKEQTVFCNIRNWEGAGGNDKSTASENVLVINSNFQMPQLNRSRKVWVYLPPDYHHSDKDYPVIYMQDGQNMFDQATSFSGEWQVDESLNQLYGQKGMGFIVVAIDNGAQLRFDEYSAWRNPRYGGGDGNKYTQFLIETLKPFVDKNFRTRSDRENTVIAGSSMGGLLSHYAVVEHPDIFGKAIVFSPSFWFTQESFWHVVEKGKQADVKVYMVAGVNERGNMLSNMLAMKRTMLAHGFEPKEVYLDAHTDGEHSEWYWAREFPKAVSWLFQAGSSRSARPKEKEDFQIMLTREGEKIMNLQSDGELPSKVRYAIYDPKGNLIQKPKKVKIKENTPDGAKGFLKLKKMDDQRYYIHLLDGEKVLLVEDLN